MPIDYSKWDNLEEYSSSSEDETEKEGTGARVTRLDAPSQVTFGGNDDDRSATITPSPSTASQPAVVPKTSVGKSMTFKHKDSGDDPSAYQAWKAKGGLVMTEDTRRLFWSQDRYSICIRLELLKDETIQSIQGTGVVPYTDRFCAVGTTKPTLSVTSSLSVLILQGELPHPIHFAQDEDEIEWSIERSHLDERFLIMTLYKAVPMQGISIWWKRPMMKFDEIINPEWKDKQSSTASKEFLSAWEEAHRLFREGKKK